MNKYILAPTIVFAFLLSSAHAQNDTRITFTTTEEAAQYAIQNSKELKLEEMNVTLALKNSKLNILSFFPTLGFSFSEADSVRMNQSDSDSKSLGATITQKIYDGGKTYLSYKVSKEQAVLAYRKYQTDVRSFSLNIYNLYYNVLLNEASVAINGQLVKNAQVQFDIIKAEYELGVALESDYLEYLIKYKQIVNEFSNCKRSLQTAYRKFNTAVGLEPEIPVALNDVSFLDETDEPYYGKFITFIWNTAKQNDIDLLEQSLSLYSIQKQIEFADLFFIPDVSLVGGISFSGSSYPLTEPSYSLKLSFSFTNIPVIPATLSNGFDFDTYGNRSYKDDSTGEVSSNTDLLNTYMTNKISLLSSQQSIAAKENSLYDTVFDVLCNHDDSLSEVLSLRETISLYERQLIIGQKKLDTGEMKRIDYLEILVELSKKKLALIQKQEELYCSTCKLEILLGIPFGGLNKCLEKIK